MSLSDNEAKKIKAIEDALANGNPVENLAANTQKRIRKKNAQKPAVKERFALQGIPLPPDFIDTGKKPSGNKKQESPRASLMGDVCMPHGDKKPKKRSTHNGEQERPGTALMGDVNVPRKP